VPDIHAVKQGEHISGIAWQHGFPSYKELWDHPKNAALKKLRKNPNVLFPGDEVFVPDRELRVEVRPTDQMHKFRLASTPLLVRLVLDRVYDRPYAQTSSVLRLEMSRFDKQTDGSGKIEHPIPKTLQDGAVTVKDHLSVRGATIPVDRDIPLKVGHLDPVEERSGQEARLANLGYYRGPDDPIDEDEFLSAVEEFQCEHKLAVDGKCGPQTQAKLVSVHGC
jgi:hypothetical protein